MVHCLGVIEHYLLPEGLIMCDPKKNKMSGENLHFKMSIKLGLNDFLLQRLRMSVAEITLWVYTKTIIIIFNLGE